MDFPLIETNHLPSSLFFFSAKSAEAVEYTDWIAAVG